MATLSARRTRTVVCSMHLPAGNAGLCRWVAVADYWVRATRIRTRAACVRRALCARPGRAVRPTSRTWHGRTCWAALAGGERREDPSSVDSCSQIRPSTSSVPCTRACRTDALVAVELLERQRHRRSRAGMRRGCDARAGSSPRWCRRTSGGRSTSRFTSGMK